MQKIKLWGIIKNGKIDPWAISPEKDYILDKGEKIIRVTVSYEKI